MPVFRFIARAQPTGSNPKYGTWQPANFIGLIADVSPASAERRFLENLTRMHWKLLDWKLRDQLIEEAVVKVGGSILDAYNMALKRGLWFVIDSEHFMAVKSAKNPMACARPDEAFVDKMVRLAGGRRLTDEERGYDKGENADYILNDFLVETKDLQQERLSKQKCHEKIAEIFWPYFEDSPVIPIDPSILTEEDWQRYADIMAEPIRRRIEKASSQIKTTAARMPERQWDGGIIILNSGYGSMDHDLLEQIVSKYIQKTSHIQLAVCITAKAQTNGFDTCLNWQFSPMEPSTQIEERLLDAFHKCVETTMNEWGRTGFASDPQHQPLLEPISFSCGGKTFTWDPGSLPFSFEKPH